MTLPLLPLLIEIHYRCGESPDGWWQVNETALADAEREAIALAVANGYLLYMRDDDARDRIALAITRLGRQVFRLPAHRKDRLAWLVALVRWIDIARRHARAQQGRRKGRPRADWRRPF